jgi:hypothetical protein
MKKPLLKSKFQLKYQCLKHVVETQLDLFFYRPFALPNNLRQIFILF